MKIIVVFCLGLSLASYSVRREFKTIDTETSVCESIDSLEREWYEWKTGNYHANRIIPNLERQSGIESTCQKGFFGYLYFENDSLFKSDVAKWRNHFNCKPYVRMRPF